MPSKGEGHVRSGRQGGPSLQLQRKVGCEGLKGIIALIVMFMMITSVAVATPENEVRAAFDRFVAAQNAHDIKAVESLLLGSPDFLWVTRGTAVWGQDAATKRFAVLYEGTWRLEPDAANMKVMMLGNGVAQIYVPIMFTIGAAGQSPQQTRFLMNSSPGQHSKRLESVEHLTNTGACAMRLTGGRGQLPRPRQ